MKGWPRFDLQRQHCDALKVHTDAEAGERHLQNLESLAPKDLLLGFDFNQQIRRLQKTYPGTNEHAPRADI
jgi:hypothetical protein